MKRLSNFVFVLLPLIFGCGGDGGQGMNGACGDVALVGGEVPESAGVGGYPSPGGGMLAEGTYVLSKVEIFSPNSIDAYRRRSVLSLAGNQAEWVMSKDGGPEDRWSGTFSTSGTSITFDISCPTARSGKLVQGYTATATELTLFAADGSNELGRYARQ